MFLARSAGHGFFIFSILPLFFFTACIGGGGGGGGQVQYGGASSEFQKWQFDDTILNMSFGREQLDYPAAVLAGDARSQFWLVEVDHSFPAGFAGGYLSRLTLGHGITNIGYARALPWLRRPHHIERSRSSLRATFAETVFSLVPTLTIEQITSRSRNLADNYDETEFSFSISRSY